MLAIVGVMLSQQLLTPLFCTLIPTVSCFLVVDYATKMLAIVGVMLSQQLLTPLLCTLIPTVVSGNQVFPIDYSWCRQCHRHKEGGHHNS
jgi:hypothetical protein